MTVATPAPSAAPMHFDIAETAPRQRRQAWSAALDSYFYPIDCLLPGDFAVGRVTARDIGAIRMARLCSDPMLVTRTSQHIGRRGADYYFPPLPVQGRIWLDQFGRRAEVTQTASAFVSTVEPYVYDQPLACESHTLRIAGAALRERLPGVEDFAARPLDGATHAMAGVFLAFARSFCERRDALGAEEAELLARHLLDLLALTLAGADPGSTESAVAAAHCRRVVQHVERHFRDPDLTVARIAEGVGLSERYLQKIFAGREQTVSALLRARRVAEAQRLLGTRRDNVSVVAYKAGFGDPAHFSRVFRRETGVSPQDFARN